MRNHPFGLGMGERSTLSFQTAEGKKEKSCHECYMVHQIQYLPRITPREGEHFFFHSVLKTHQQEHISPSDPL